MIPSFTEMQGYHSNQAAEQGMGGPGRMREQYETMDDDGMKETAAKRARHMPIALPAPLNDTVLDQVLAELNQGTARAVESCLQCYRDQRMTGDDLTSFMRSIAMHSQTLALVFKNVVEKKSTDMGEVACADDLAELMALAGTPACEHRDGARCQRACLTTFPSSWGTPSFPAPPCAIVTMSRDHATSSWAAASLVPAAPAMAAHDTVAQPLASKLFVARTRKTKTSSPSDEELRLMLWWSEKRVSEILRRQHETAGCNMLPSAAERNNAYVCFLMGKLMALLPTAGKLKLLAHVRAYNMTSDMATFSESVQELVDEYAVTVFLRYAPECSVRPVVQRLFSSKSCAALASIDLDYEELSIDTADDCCKHAPAGPALGALSLVLPAKQSVQGHANAQGVCAAALTRDCGGVKRKRTETLHGAHPEEEDDMASCPVCKNCPRDDDRWVKCDGCGSWYSLICLLFNEICIYVVASILQHLRPFAYLFATGITKSACSSTRSRTGKACGSFAKHQAAASAVRGSSTADRCSVYLLYLVQQYKY
jgi:hypothetical protein